MFLTNDILISNWHYIPENIHVVYFNIVTKLNGNDSQNNLIYTYDIVKLSYYRSDFSWRDEIQENMTILQSIISL